MRYSYIHFDETYHTVLDKSCTKGSRKGYIWAALSYIGAIQADRYISYKELDGWGYPKTIRLGYIQHCKRYFIEIEKQKESKEIIGTYNKFYLIRKNIPEEK